MVNVWYALWDNSTTCYQVAKENVTQLAQQNNISILWQQNVNVLKDITIFQEFVMYVLLVKPMNQ